MTTISQLSRHEAVFSILSSMSVLYVCLLRLRNTTEVVLKPGTLWWSIESCCYICSWGVSLGKRCCWLCVDQIRSKSSNLILTPHNLIQNPFVPVKKFLGMAPHFHLRCYKTTKDNIVFLSCYKRLINLQSTCFTSQRFPTAPLVAATISIMNRWAWDGWRKPKECTAKNENNNIWEEETKQANNITNKNEPKNGCWFG